MPALSEPIPSSMSFTLCSHQMDSSTFCSASHPAVQCFLRTPGAIQLWHPPGQLWGRLPSAVLVLPGAVLCPAALPGSVTLRGPARAARSPAGPCSRWHCCFPDELLPWVRFPSAGKGQR